MALCTAVPDFLTGHSLEYLHHNDMQLQCISNLPDLEITSVPMEPTIAPKNLCNEVARHKVVHTASKTKESSKL